MKVWADAKCQHGRPFWNWLHRSFWQPKTSDEVVEVYKQLKFKSGKSMQVEFISNNIDVMTHGHLSSVPCIKGPYRQKIFFFIIHFYVIMHRTTIVQNKIISIIWSWLFLGPDNIYRPSLGKVRLARPNKKPLPAFNFYLRKKRKQQFYSELHPLQRLIVRFSILLFIYLKKKYKNFAKKKPNFWHYY